MINWLEDRTAIPSTLRKAFLHPCAGAPRWRFVWGFAALFLFVLLGFTGLLLALVYSASPMTAWGSVWFIQRQLPAGWIIRGVHHFASDALLVVLILGVLQSIAWKAYRAPRELAWWCSLALLGVALALSLTGHLLPWDQHGYWGTTVRVNIAAKAPIMGDAFRRLILGGPQPGQATLTRFYALHALILPMAAILLFGCKIVSRVRQGPATTKAAGIPVQPYWPAQFFRDTFASVIILALLLALTWITRSQWGNDLLSAPADPFAQDYPARPEWHTLFLYQWLKYFNSPQTEMLGAILAPAAIAALFFTFPWLPRMLGARFARGVTVGSTVVILGGIAWLTAVAIIADLNPADAYIDRVRSKQQAKASLTDSDNAALSARQFHHDKLQARGRAKRAIFLADREGIPPLGPLELLANDPQTRGPMLFAGHCASCHRYDGHDGLGNFAAEPANSSDLRDFSSFWWVRGLLKDPMGSEYLGLMTKPNGEPAHTRMSKWVKEQRETNSSDQARRELVANFNAVAAYLQDESTHPGRLADMDIESDDPTDEDPNALGESLIRRGRRFFMTTCNECHSYQGQRRGTLKAPEMYGYGSVDWITKFIADPAHNSLYRNRGREPAQMPSFENRLTARQRQLIALWLTSRDK